MVKDCMVGYCTLLVYWAFIVKRELPDDVLFAQNVAQACGAAWTGRIN